MPTIQVLYQPTPALPPEPSSDPIALFTFGKYRNEPIKDVLRYDPGYLVWVYNTVANHGGVSKCLFKRAHAELAKLGPVNRYGGIGNPMADEGWDEFDGLDMPEADPWR